MKTQTQPHVAFVGDILEINDAARDIIRRKKFSFSAAQAQHGCRARFAFDKLSPAPADPMQPTSLGSAAHAIFETIMDLPGKQRTQKKAKELIRDRANTLIADGTLAAGDYTSWRERVEAMTLPLWKIRPVAKIKTVGTEVSLDTTVGDVPLIGYIDLVEKTDSGLAIVDYKTGKLPNLNFGDKHGDQIRLYSHLYTSLTGEQVTDAHLYYTGTDIALEDRTRNVSVGEAEKQRVLDDIQAMWDIHQQDMTTGTLPATVSPLCSWCPAVNHCPLAQKNNISADQRYTGTKTASDLYLTSTPTPENPVTARKVFSDAKPWEDTPGYVNGSAYASAGIFGYLDLAVETYRDHSTNPSRDDIIRLAHTFQWLVNGTQPKIATTADPNAGINTRLRAALRTSLLLHPAPIGEPNPAWEAWAKQVYDDLKFFAIAAADMATTTHTPFFITQNHN